MLAIGGMPDHIHIFIGFNPADSISSLVAEIKKATSAYIKTEKFVQSHFEWQAGYGVFSNSRSQISAVCKYIENQKQHHNLTSFEVEFQKMLKDFGLEQGNKKLFEF